MKTFFLVPGFRMQIKDKPFKWLVNYLEEKGVRVVKTPVDWNYKTLTINAAEFVDFYNKNKGQENYILGFSYGAVITLLTANELKPHKIFLCSLSPDFAEDKHWLKQGDIKYIGKRRYSDTRTRFGRVTAKNLKVPSVIFCGEVEGKKYPELLKRCEETAKIANNSKIIMVKNAPHQIDFEEYQKAIMKEVSDIA